MICLEEVDKRTFLFVGERCLDANSLGRVIWIDRGFLRFLSRLEGPRACLGGVQRVLGDDLLELGHLPSGRQRGGELIVVALARIRGPEGRTCSDDFMWAGHLQL